MSEVVSAGSGVQRGWGDDMKWVTDWAENTLVPENGAHPHSWESAMPAVGLTVITTEGVPIGR